MSRNFHQHKPRTYRLLTWFLRRIQEEGLRTYLFTYAPYYSTLSLSLLSRTFSLSLRTVTSTVSKMIWTEELAASLDQSSGVVVFHRVESTRAQQLAQSLADKLGTLIEQNEKGLDLKLGGGSAWADRADGSKQEKRTGDQAGERRRTGERRGGTASRGTCPPLKFSGVYDPFISTSSGGARGGRGARFAQGLGNRMGQASQRTRVGT